MKFAYCRVYPCLGEELLRVTWWRRWWWRITNQKPICEPCRKAMRRARV